MKWNTYSWVKIEGSKMGDRETDRGVRESSDLEQGTHQERTLWRPPASGPQQGSEAVAQPQTTPSVPQASPSVPPHLRPQPVPGPAGDYLSLLLWETWKLGSGTPSAPLAGHEVHVPQGCVWAVIRQPPEHLCLPSPRWQTPPGKPNESKDGGLAIKNPSICFNSRWESAHILRIFTWFFKREHTQMTSLHPYPIHFYSGLSIKNFIYCLKHFTIT